MDTKDILQSCLGLAALIIAGTTARIGLRTFRFNARTKRAEYLLSLHKAFFVEESYKAVRDVLDSDNEDSRTELRRYLKDEPREFTDFLNFFELVTYLSATNTLKRSQVEALLGYYLNVLASRPDLREYIMREDRSFEHLAAFLKRREADQRNRRSLDG